jgi:hypothetical protein
MYPHRIRLRGPWECQPLSGAAILPAGRRVTMPGRLADLGLSGFSGRVRFVRKFGYPGQLEPHDRVWLTFGGVQGCCEVRLNDQVLGAERGGAFEFEITRLLNPRNRLDVVLDAADDQAGLWGEVALEIRATAYLRGLTCRRESATMVRAAGEIAGESDGPLELYGIADGRHVYYAMVNPGEPFEFAVEGDAASAAILRVELVKVSVVWYVAEVSLPEVRSSGGA